MDTQRDPALIDAIGKVNGAKVTPVLQIKQISLYITIDYTKILENANPSSKMTADSVQSPATVMNNVTNLNTVVAG